MKPMNALLNALMPGEHNYMRGKPMPGQIQSSPLPEMGAQPLQAQPQAMPAQKSGFRRDRGPVMNALGGFFEFAAPEAYDAGRQRKLGKMESDALGASKYDEAGRYRMQAGDFEGGAKIADYGQQQAATARQQEAQKLVTVMSSATPEQLTQLAMSDPAGFEQASGVSSEEYLSSMKRLMEQGGMDMQSAHQFVLQQAQAEAGIAPQGPTEGKVVNNRLVNPYTGELMGDYSDAEKPIEVNGVLVDPRTYQPVADFRTPAQTGEMTTYQRAQLANEAARLGISEAELLFKMQQAETGAGANRPRAQDQNGVLRYIDTGEEVFPNVAKNGGGKPLIGAEAMARVAAGLPNAKGAVQDLETLTFNSKATPLSQAGYDPASDWGAAVIEAIPDWGLLKGLARWSGGEDYQMFKDSYGAFEAGMLPIISGAAITDTEAKRQMQALQIKPGDSKDTKRRKLDLMAQMVQGVELAARGDTQGFLSVLDDVGTKSGAGPVKRGGATGFEQTPDDELFYILRGE